MIIFLFYNLKKTNNFSHLKFEKLYFPFSFLFFFFGDHYYSNWQSTFKRCQSFLSEEYDQPHFLPTQPWSKRSRRKRIIERVSNLGEEHSIWETKYWLSSLRKRTFDGLTNQCLCCLCFSQIHLRRCCLHFF